MASWFPGELLEINLGRLIIRWLSIYLAKNPFKILFHGSAGDKKKPYFSANISFADFCPGEQFNIRRLKQICVQDPLEPPVLCLGRIKFLASALNWMSY